MMTDDLKQHAAGHLFERVGPLVAQSDGDGNLTNVHVPSDAGAFAGFQGAAHLRMALPAPVGNAWTNHVRAALAERRVRGALAVLGGESHEVWALPAPAASTATIVAFRGAMEHLPAPLVGTCSIGVITEHVWGVLEPLSRGQLTTLRAIASGMDNDGIAKAMHRTKRAVEWHIRSLYLTLSCGTREELGTIGRRAGLCRFNEDAWLRVLAARPARRGRSETE
jgi:DNA-binding CsgD family transcriptional regulator